MFGCGLTDVWLEAVTLFGVKMEGFAFHFPLSIISMNDLLLFFNPCVLGIIVLIYPNATLLSYPLKSRFFLCL
jgi:hypothetical protein